MQPWSDSVAQSASNLGSQPGHQSRTPLLAMLCRRETLASGASGVGANVQWFIGKTCPRWCSRGEAPGKSD